MITPGHAYFAHRIFYGKEVFSNFVIRISDVGVVLYCREFTGESPFTTYVNGILLVLDETFSGQEDIFFKEIRSLSEMESLDKAILQSTVYRKYSPRKNSKCLIYNIETVDWHPLRLIPDSRLAVIH